MIKGTEIKYIAAGRYSLRKESENIKKADNELRNTLIELEKEAKKKRVEFALAGK
jgi:translation initiation factor 2 alpha subunit (eIF-2alpha)